MSLGCEVKSLIGTGIFLSMYSHMTSMLYFSWAEIGTMGAPSATVPVVHVCMYACGNTMVCIITPLMNTGKVFSRLQSK